MLPRVTSSMASRTVDLPAEFAPTRMLSPSLGSQVKFWRMRKPLMRSSEVVPISWTLERERSPRNRHHFNSPTTSHAACCTAENPDNTYSTTSTKPHTHLNEKSPLSVVSTLLSRIKNSIPYFCLIVNKLIT